MDMCFLFMVEENMEELLTTLSSSQSILVESTTEIPSIKVLKHSAVICYTQGLASINSLEKVLTSTVFYLLIYKIISALFNKMINPVLQRRVTLLDAWEASAYAVVLTGMLLVSGNIFKISNCSSAYCY